MEMLFASTAATIFENIMFEKVKFSNWAEKIMVT